MTLERFRLAATIAGGVAGLLALSGCTAIAGVFKDDTSDAVITVAPALQGKVAPAYAPVTVAVANGQLTNVNVLGPTGKALVGAMNKDQTVWVSNVDKLAYGAQYTVSATAIDRKGLATQAQTVLKTVDPSKLMNGYYVYFNKGDKVGVGMPIRLEFTRAVKNRAAVERHLLLRTSRPVTGAWSWDNSGKAVTFRPKRWWPARTKVFVDAQLHGVQTSKGVFAERDIKTRFTVGSSMISVVDAASHTLTVTRNGKVVQEIPVTTGKSGFETRSGIVPIMAKEGTVIMDAASGGTPKGSPEYYRLTVNYSMRLTLSGEFLHAAPWSAGSQGYANTSHGCVGMGTGNAMWLYDHSTIGDPVIIRNTGRMQDMGNGMTEWNIKWKKWVKHSATGVQHYGPHSGKVSRTTT